ncbi:MAG: peptide chain release factor N(5)-glutamine methyltransferase [Gemmataceae bacterium]|nr:peptide chain release factor N(5)-glutamine methyltransferase [Gemmataceae bacterium]
MADTTWTIKALLAWTADHFAKKGLESPRLDAELLLAHVLACKRIDLIVRYDEQPNEAQRAAFRSLVQKRLERCPTAYLVGTREFYLLPFEVNAAVLIPRPDTETLVDVGIEFLKKRPAPTVLDLGTGSGCVAVCLAHNVKAARVTAVDVSPDAVAVAERNAVRNGVADRIDFRVGNLFAAVEPGTRFDLIVSNPPYIPPSEIETLMPEVKDHEPRLALDGGTDGLAFYRRLTAEARGWLKSGGLLAVEIGHTQGIAVRELFDAAGLRSVAEVKDRGGRPRVVCGTAE